LSLRVSSQDLPLDLTFATNNVTTQVFFHLLHSFRQKDLSLQTRFKKWRKKISAWRCYLQQLWFFAKCWSPPQLFLGWQTRFFFGCQINHRDMTCPELTWGFSIIWHSMFFNKSNRPISILYKNRWKIVFHNLIC